MNVLEKVIIEGLWGDRNIDIKFHRDINFFIGVNGSGKTTSLCQLKSVPGGKAKVYHTI